MKEQINTLLKSIGLKAEEIKLMEAKLADGQTMIEAEPDFEAGAAVMVVTEDEQRIPVPVSGEGEAYELEDGRTFTVVEEGVIAEVMEAGAQEEAPEQEEEVAASNDESETPLPKAIIESVVKETKFSQEDMDAKELEITELKAQLAEATKEEVVEEVEEVELSAKPIVQNPEPQAEVKLHTYGNKRKRNTKDSVMSKIAKLK